MRRLPVLACALVLALPASALAEDPPYVELTGHLPALPGGFTESTWKACDHGSPACVEATLDEMYSRFDELYADCHHNAVFALTYIRVTEIYAERADTFEEPQFLAHEDAVFAQMYFEAYDAWDVGSLEVPPAWREAFDAAANRTMPALGNILLGINGHVNRDMPFMLAGLGLVKPDGTPRKADHDYVNKLLNEVYDDVIAETTARFDPAADDYEAPGTLDNFVIFQILPLWREAVWRHAEMLTKAPTPEARELVARYIEDYARGQAEFIQTMMGYRAGQTSAARDAHCADPANRTPVRPG